VICRLKNQQIKKSINQEIEDTSSFARRTSHEYLALNLEPRTSNVLLAGTLPIAHCPLPKGTVPFFLTSNLERRTSNSGFTLLEVMLAVAVLAIALPILLGLRNADVAMRQEARAMTTAVLLAQEKLFEMDLLGFPPIGEVRGDFAAPGPGSPATSETKDRAPGYRWLRMVTTTPFEQIREVSVRVTWPAGGSERAVEITNYVFRENPARPS